MSSLERSGRSSGFQVRYDQRHYSDSLPFKVEVNKPRVQALLDSRGIPEDVQESLVVEISPTTAAYGENLYEGQNAKYRAGDVNLTPDVQGKRVIGVYTFSNLNDSVGVIMAAEKYSRVASVYKAYYPVGYPRVRVAQEAELLTRTFDKTRILPYLEGAPFERSQRFIIKTLEKRLQKTFSSTILHEVAHLDDIEKVSALDEKSKKQKKYFNAAVMSLATGLGMVLVNTLTDRDFVEYMKAAWVSLVSGGATGVLKLQEGLLKSGQKLRKLTGEVHALEEEIENRHLWQDLVKLTPSGYLFDDS